MPLTTPIPSVTKRYRADVVAPPTSVNVIDWS